MSDWDTVGCHEELHGSSIRAVLRQSESPNIAIRYGAMDGIWENFLNIIRQESGSRVVDTWFKAIVLHRWDALERIMYLKAPNQFVCDWVQRNYITLIYTHMSRLLNAEVAKVIIVDEQAVVSLAPATLIPSSAVRTLELSPSSSVGASRRTASHARINKHYSFDDFVVGPSNSLAYAAAHAVTQKPGTLYNPLFIYGGSGLGKTHLLHAIGNGIKAGNKNALILYETTDRFVNEFISAIRFDRIHKFQEKYRHVDVLLIDDIQFISNKEQTQEAFFHIFNALHESHKQIVFSGDVYPQHIEGIADRLRSRLASGMVADILMPPLETKIAIVKKKAEANALVLDDTIAHFIASRVVTSVRELEGALVRVMAFSSLTKQPITQELVCKVLGSAIAEQAKPSIDLEAVARCLRKYYPYDLKELRSGKRNKDLSLVRHIAMFLMKRVTDKSLRDIGTLLGGRNHATVVHALHKIEQCIEKDDEFKNHLFSMERDLLEI